MFTLMSFAALLEPLLWILGNLSGLRDPREEFSDAF